MDEIATKKKHSVTKWNFIYCLVEHALEECATNELNFIEIAYVKKLIFEKGNFHLEYNFVLQLEWENTEKRLINIQ